MSANYRSESETLESPLLPAAAENLERSYFEVLGLCCSSEVALIENILKPLQGVKEVYVIVPSKTVIVVHDSLLISALQIVNVLNKARLEANIRAKGDADDKKKWPSPNVIICGLLLALSFLKYLYQPFQWVALGAVAVGIFPILMRAFVAVRNFTLDVNVLMLLAVVGTTALSDFLEAGTIVFLFTIAQWLESKASHKANAVMTSLMSLAPQKAVIAGTGESVDVQDVKMNTILAVKAGETVPLDGLVVDGNAEVDEKMLTGESFPVNKEKDFIILAGTIVLNGYVSVMTTALAENCVVARMAKLVEEAQNRKSKTQRLIDTCSKYYTPVIVLDHRRCLPRCLKLLISSLFGLCLAVVVLISACIAAIPAALRVPNQSNWFHLALVVLVSACPCGLILSTPVATFCALSQAASIGLLFKGGDYLEILAKTKVVAFDKTGTITKGEFLLTDFDTLSNDVSTNTLLYWVSSIESKSSHPISTAVVNYAESLSIRPKPENVQDFKSFPGEGVCGKIDGCEIYIGNKKFGGRAGCVTSRDMEDPERDGRSLGYIYSGGALIGSFRLSDIVRLGAIDAVSDLNSMGIRTAMLTGDSHAAAMHVQNELQQGLAAVYAELLPEEKAQIIHEFKNIGPTVMVGDGVNDAPALATADIGISMGVSGSALAMETGHVILMSNDIRKIPKSVQLARNTRRKVIENLFFSTAVKAAVLALAFAGHPIIWVAVLADVLTCLLVISNSMLLLRGSYNYGHNQKCQRSPIPGHSQNKCANTKAECKSSKCASLKCARSSEPVKCKDVAEHCRGGDKQRKHCCSQNICQAKLGRSSQEPAELCQGIPDDSSSSRNKTCINSVEQQPEQDCCKTITCSEKSCCVDDVVCCEDMAERQGSCQEDEHLAGGRSCDHEMEAGSKQGQFKQLDDLPTLAGAMNIHPHQHELKCCGNERVMEETQPEIETEAQTCARGIGGQKNSSGCEEHCSRVCHKADNLHGASQGHAMPKHACVSLGSTGSGACCSRSSRKECCASSAGCGGCLSEIVIE